MKKLRLVIALMLSVFLLAACATDPTPETPPPADPEPVEAVEEDPEEVEEVEEAEEVEEVEEVEAEEVLDNVDLTPGVFPVIRDPSQAPRMRVAKQVSPLLIREIDEIPMIAEIAEETGVFFDWEAVPAAGATERVNLMIAGGDLPDAFWHLISEEMIAQFMGQNVFLPTQDLIDTYMPHLQRVFNEAPQYRAMATAPDGNMYGFPYIEEMFGLVLTPGPFLINQVWLDEAGLDMPATIDEWADALRAFRDMGRTPFAFNLGARDAFGSFDTFFQFTGAFGQAIPVDGTRPESFLTVQNDEVVFVGNHIAMRDTANWFHELHMEGLICIDSFSPFPGDWGAFYLERIRAEGAVIGSFGVWAPVGDIPVFEERIQYVPIPRMTGPAGRTGFANNFSEMQRASAFTITTAAQYPEILARYSDYLYIPDVSFRQNWGAIGYTFERNEDGTLRSRLDETGSPIMVPPFETVGEMAQNSRGEKGAIAILNSYYDVYGPYAWDALDLLAFQRINGKEEILAEMTSVPRMIMTVEEARVVAQIQPIILSLVNEFRMSAILDGTGNANWDQFNEDLIAAGLDQMLDAYNSAYARFLDMMAQFE